MNKGQKILIIGASILTTGIILIAISLMGIGGSFTYMSSTETIAPGQSSNHIIDATQGENMTVMLDVQPSTVPMNIMVGQIVPDNRGMVEILANANFSGTTSLSFTPTNDEDVGLFISNRGQEQATVNMVAGTDQFFANAEPGTLPTPNMALGVTAVIGPFLAIIGFIVLIVGAIVWFIGRIRGRRREE